MEDIGHIEVNTNKLSEQGIDVDSLSLDSFAGSVIFEDGPSASNGWV